VPISEDRIKVNLQEVYNSEDRLGIKRIDFYKSLGITFLLRRMEATARCESLYREPLKFELIDGCHECKALLELNVQEAFIKYEGVPLKSRDDLILLKDILVLDEKEYIEWYKKTYGSYPIWSNLER